MTKLPCKATSENTFRRIANHLFVPILILTITFIWAVFGWADSSLAKDADRPFGKSGSYDAAATTKGYLLVSGMGEETRSSVFKWTIQLKNLKGKGFLHNVVGECFGLVLYEHGLNHQTGWCRYIDEEGDMFYEQFEHDGNLGKGGGKSIGGTGKYEGVISTHEYSFDPLGDEDEIESIAVRSGKYRFKSLDRK